MREEHDLVMRPKFGVEKCRKGCMLVICRANLRCTKDINILLGIDWLRSGRMAKDKPEDTMRQHAQTNRDCAARPTRTSAEKVQFFGKLHSQAYGRIR